MPAAIPQSPFSPPLVPWRLGVQSRVAGQPSSAAREKNPAPKPESQYHCNPWRYQNRRSPRATAQNRGCPLAKPHFKTALAFFAKERGYPTGAIENADPAQALPAPRPQ
jgi:hypothetical protein